MYVLTAHGHPRGSARLHAAAVSRFLVLSEPITLTKACCDTPPLRARFRWLRIAAIAICVGDSISPKIGDVLQRKKLSTTIGANSYAYLHGMVKAGKAESVGQAVDRAVEMARRLDNRATLERQTAAYFKGLPAKATAEENDLEDALSAASQEMDFDQP